MKLLDIILIACGGFVLLIILFITLVALSNKRKSKKLNSNLKKYQQENQDFQEDKTVIVADDDSQEKMEESKHIIEEFQAQEIYKPVVEETRHEEKKAEPPFPDDFFMPINFMKESTPFKDDIGNDKTHSIVSQEEREKQKRKARDKEFEQFMNQHSFSRKILDKRMIEKIKTLPPELKAVLLTSVFDKFDENK